MHKWVFWGFWWRWYLTVLKMLHWCRPKQMLLGFARTQLLKPGDSTKVCVPLDLADLRLMAADGTSFGLLPGDYTLSVGGASPGTNGLFVATVAPQTVSLTLT
jgi:hypothetical protein